MKIIGAAIVICLFISMYNLWMMGKILKAFAWILGHVHVVGKNNQKDPDFEQIKRTFGIEEKEDPGK